MGELRDQIKSILDSIISKLDWVDRVIPGFIRSLIPALVVLDEIKAVLKTIRYLITFGGDSVQLRAAAARLRQLTSDLTQFSNSVSVSKLTATDPNVWTDVNASTAYVQRIADQAGYFGEGQTWAQALGDALDADAGVIDEFYSDLFSTIMDMLGALLSIASAVLDVLGAVETLGVTLAAAIVSLVNGIVSLVSAVHEAVELWHMEAPTISPTAEGQNWPVPVLW